MVFARVWLRAVADGYSNAVVPRAAHACQSDSEAQGADCGRPCDNNRRVRAPLAAFREVNKAEKSTGTFRREDRLLAKRDFDRVFDDAQRSRDRCFTVLFCHNTVGHPRLGLAISKRRVRRAVGRNRLKRIVRESFRRHRYSLPPADIVVMAGSDAADADNANLFDSLERHWGRVRKAIGQQL